jgi:TM2 domain-containing membrane protein YozV
MESNKVDMFIMANGKYFESHQVVSIRDKMLKMPEEKWVLLQTMQFKDPTTSLIVSLLGGQLGIDRFLIGDTGMGVGKLLTCGGFGIWAIIDWFLIMDATRQKNTEKLAAVFASSESSTSSTVSSESIL